MDTRIGVAIIGSGLFVRDEHLPAVLAHDGLELKAIYSRSLKSAQAVSEGLSDVDLYSDDSGGKGYDDLLARPDVGAVILALPIMVQPSFIRKALVKGKHVLAEKPLAPDVATGKELLDFYHEQVDDKSVNFSIAEQFRYTQKYVLAAQKAREMGDVIGCRVCVLEHMTRGSQYYETEWRKNAKHQGGWLLDGGVHFVAGMRMLLGSEAKIATVSAQSTLLQDDLPPVDTLDATLKLSNGKTGTFSVSFGTPVRVNNWTVFRTGGSATVTESKVIIQYTDEEEWSKDLTGAVGGVVLEIAAWVKSLKEHRWDAAQSAEEGLADLEVLEACLKSAENGGQPVELKYQTQTGY